MIHYNVKMVQSMLEQEDTSLNMFQAFQYAVSNEVSQVRGINCSWQGFFQHYRKKDQEAGCLHERSSSKQEILSSTRFMSVLVPGSTVGS